MFDYFIDYFRFNVLQKPLFYKGFDCGRWDLNPHEHTPTRSLVLPVCQFQHSRLPVERSFQTTSKSIANIFHIVNTFLGNFIIFFVLFATPFAHCLLILLFQKTGTPFIYLPAIFRSSPRYIKRSSLSSSSSLRGCRRLLSSKISASNA